MNTILADFEILQKSINVYDDTHHKYNQYFSDIINIQYSIHYLEKTLQVYLQNHQLSDTFKDTIDKESVKNKWKKSTKKRIWDFITNHEYLIILAKYKYKKEVYHLQLIKNDAVYLHDYVNYYNTQFQQSLHSFTNQQN